MTIKFQPENHLQNIAHDMARTITTRDHGTRETTGEEARKMYPIIYGALLTINYVGRAADARALIQGAKDAAEFIFDITFPGMNGYDSVYCKLDDYIRGNRED